MTYRAFALSSLATLMLWSCQDVAPKSTEDSVQQAKISQADIGRRIEMLASDEFEGRAPSTPGGQKASQYVADEMNAAGLSPAAKDGSFFQPVTLTESTTLESSTMSLSKDGAVFHTSDQSTNSVYWSKRPNATLSVSDSDIVFVGYGVVAPEYGWDDYAGLDVEGKTVVMLVNDPGFSTKDDSLFKGESMTYYGRWTYKYEEAGRQGAAAAIVIHETAPASYGWGVVSGSWTGAQYDLIRPDGGASRTHLEGWVHYDAAKEMFELAGLDIEAQKQAALQKGFKPVPMTGLTLDGTINQTVSTVQSRNVVGEIKGTETPDEYVLYMAHWDHLGNGADGEDHIFNGAVDNATGTAAILEIAKGFADQGAPKRSAIFVAVTAEESGLLGSAYYAEDPIVPLSKTVAGINIDAMLPIGRTEDVIVVGAGASQLEDRLTDILTPRGMYTVPDPKPQAGYYYRSDHISLAKKGVPMLYADAGLKHRVNGLSYGEAFAEGYTNDRYHKVGDEYDNTWDLSGITEMTEIFFELGYGIADSDEWPNWYEGTEFRALWDDLREE
ncbi:MAG: M28 family metallopeptidase [Maricaulaceae bacterium]